MQLHHVRVHRSDENLARDGQLAWKIAEVAARHAQGRLVSMLEGGYNLAALAQSAGVHVKGLMDAGA